MSRESNDSRARVLTPPHSTSARGSDNLHYHYHDLVAISMGTGGWVFKIKSRLSSPDTVLEPKCHVYDIEVKHAGCGIDMCVLTCDISSRQPNQGPPQVNDVLTPRACLTLLANTLTLGEPYSVQPFFVLHCPHCWSSREVLSITYSSICVGCVTGICYRIGLVQVYLCTLLPNAL